MTQLAAQIIYNRAHSTDLFRLGVQADDITFIPGQFVMISIPGNRTFLRRPFGIACMENNGLEICYKVVGKGTQALNQLQVGQSLDIIAPLGNGFNIDSNSTPLLIAGGYGIAPIFALAMKLIACNKQPIVYYGVQTKSDLVYYDEMIHSGIDVRITTDDGSCGARGLITQVLEGDLETQQSSELFACGPHGLLKAVAQLASSYDLPAQVSTEEYMACGIGVCMGCVCQMNDHTYKRTCHDGPVFDAKELLWT